MTGRKDFAFFPGHEEEIDFCLEANRLNGVKKALADEYVKEGVQRFVDRSYSRMVRHVTLSLLAHAFLAHAFLAHAFLAVLRAEADRPPASAARKRGRAPAGSAS